MVVALLALASAAPPQETLTWTGIDYGLVRMVGTEDFTEPAAIFPGYLNTWNTLFLDEYLSVLGRRLRRQILPSTGHLAALHAATEADAQILRVDGPSADTPVLGRAEVVARVASYPVSGSGMALTYIADQLSKPDRKGCFWVTYFDLGSRAVHETTYRCGNAGGFGFRNYWFGPVKSVTDILPFGVVPPPSARVELTEAEMTAAAARSEAMAGIMAQARERAAQDRASAEARRQALADRVAREAEMRNWVSIRIAPEGLALLKENGVGFEVVQAVAVAAPAPSFAPAAGYPEAECETAFGKTACGYDCKVAFGDVKCAGSPGGKCEVAFGEITCSR